MPKVVCFGLLTIDHLLTVDSVPGPNDKIVALASDLDVGGPAANAAATASALGDEVRLVVAVGNSPLTSYAVARLNGWGVTVDDLLFRQDGSPPMSVVLVTKASGERAVISRNAADVRPDLQLRGDEVMGADVLLVDGHHMECAIRLARAAKQVGTLVLFDGGSWKEGTDELLPYVDVALVSGDFHVPSGGDPLLYLADQGCWAAAQSAGAGPIRVLCRGEEALVEVPQVTDVVDTLGAGDVLHGALAHFLAQSGARGATRDGVREDARESVWDRAQSGARDGVPDGARQDVRYGARGGARGGGGVVDALVRAAGVASQSCRSRGAHGWFTGGFSAHSHSLLLDGGSG